jgi:excisionase family DNA binding protein
MSHLNQVELDEAMRSRWQALLAAEPEYLTTQEVADHLRTSPETVRYWRHIGSGPPSWKCGRRVLYPRADLDLWIAAARSATPGGAA